MNALRRTASRLERVTAAPGRTVVAALAGGLDPTCGLTSVARSATLGAPGPFAPTPDGGAWLDQKPPQQWNKPGMQLPQAPRRKQSAAR